METSALSAAERAKILRLIDANTNRAGEGLRTIEDIARLVREDPIAAEWMKTLRHELGGICGQLPRKERLMARSVETDAGRAISGSHEMQRTDVTAVAAAAAERTTQSLRNLEEYSKLLASSLSEQFKQLRYAAYDVLARTELRLRDDHHSMSERLYVLFDCQLPLDAFAGYVRALADAGMDYMQLRDKSADGARLMHYARAAKEGLNGTATELFINDRLDIALACGAAGVHIGQEDISLADAVRIAHGQLRIGVSTHNLQQALEAEQGGADYIGCGPTFPSQTKQFQEFAGLSFLRQIAEEISIPAFAIGGIDLDNLPSVLATGVGRVAVGHAIHAAEHPADITRLLQSMLREPRATAEHV